MIGEGGSRMKIRRASLFWFLGFHALAVAAVLLFPYYRLGAGVVFSFLPSCLLHDVFHIYCPLCGGTRAVDAILHFHFPEAMRFNPLVVTFLLLAAVWYGIAWVRLFRGKSLLAPVPKALSVSIAVAFVGYWIVRNLLLIAFGVDPMGDLVGFWQ